MYFTHLAMNCSALWNRLDLSKTHPSVHIGFKEDYVTHTKCMLAFTVDIGIRMQNKCKMPQIRVRGSVDFKIRGKYTLHKPYGVIVFRSFLVLNKHELQKYSNSQIQVNKFLLHSVSLHR